jgi:phosphomannomutase / phosphoglucomutase
MRFDIHNHVPYNSFEYFEKTLMTDNGFREYDVRWIVGDEINPNAFVVLGKAYGTMAQEVLKEDKVIVGHDFRQYSQDLQRSLIVGLMSTGVHVIDIGLALTPTVYYAQHHLNVRAACQVTASHNENGWCGMKIASGLSRTLGPEGIIQFKEIVHGGKFATGNGSYEAFDGMPELFIQDAVGDFKLKKPIKVVVAAGNGTGGRFAPDAMRRLGCEVVEVDCTPDWDFKKHNPNPEEVSFLHGIVEAVEEHGAVIGLGIDGDGDRIGVVDDKGREVYSDKMGLILARWICRQHPGRSVVIDVKSTGLFFDDKVLRETNTEVILWKTGHSYIKSKVAEANAIAGFEKSGHWFLNEPYGRAYDDCITASVQLLKMLDESEEPLSHMIDQLPKTWQSPTLGAYCPDNLKYDVVDTIAALYTADYENGLPIAGKKIRQLITVNGIRFQLEDDSWGLLRASSNKPALVIVAEARSNELQMHDIVDHIKARLATTGKVGDYDQEMPARPAA